MRIHQLSTGTIFMEKPVHDENTEIIPHTENERGQDDIHYIELNTKHFHDSRDDNPADRHRQETEQCQFEPAVRKPEYKENQERRNEQYKIEIVVDTLRRLVREITLVENDHIRISIETGIDFIDVSPAHSRLTDKHFQIVRRAHPAAERHRDSLSSHNLAQRISRILRLATRRILTGRIAIRRIPAIEPLHRLIIS